MSDSVEVSGGNGGTPPGSGSAEGDDAVRAWLSQLHADTSQQSSSSSSSLSILMRNSDVLSRFIQQVRLRYDTIRHTHTRLTALFRDYPGEPVPER